MERKRWVPDLKADEEKRKEYVRLLYRGVVRDNGYKQAAECVEVSSGQSALVDISQESKPGGQRARVTLTCITIVVKSLYHIEYHSSSHYPLCLIDIGITIILITPPLHDRQQASCSVNWGPQTMS